MLNDVNPLQLKVLKEIWSAVSYSSWEMFVSTASYEVAQSDILKLRLNNSKDMKSKQQISGRIILNTMYLFVLSRRL